MIKDFIIFKITSDCSQAGDLFHHSHPYPCLPQKVCLPQNRRRRPSPVSTTRMNTLCIPVSTVLFTMMMCSVSLFASLSIISCIQNHSSSAEKMSSECPVQGSEPALVSVPSDGKEVLLGQIFYYSLCQYLLGGIDFRVVPSAKAVLVLHIS